MLMEQWRIKFPVKNGSFSSPVLMIWVWSCVSVLRVFDVKSLIQFRSVSKPSKSFIDSSDFIKCYGARHTQLHSRIVSLLPGSQDDNIFLIDDNIESVEVKEFAPSFVVSPLLKQYRVSYVVDTCHGLLCLYGFHKGYKKWMRVIWNHSIGKSFGIAVPRSYGQFVFGFGVCPNTRDPTVVKILCQDPWHVEVFTLSSGVWNVIPSGNLPPQSIRLNPISTQVVIDRFSYWAASEKTLTDDGVPHYKYMVVSFDLITTEFKVVDLPDTLTKELCSCCFVSKLRESLVVYGYIESAHCGVWVMEHDSYFRKLFTIGKIVDKILGFKKNGEPIFETRIVGKDSRFTTLDVYNPYSQQIKNLGIFGIGDSFFMGSYKESLLLLDHLDSHTYDDSN